MVCRLTILVLFILSLKLAGAQDTIIRKDTVTVIETELKSPDIFPLGLPNHSRSAFYNTKNFSINNGLFSERLGGFTIDHLDRIWYFSFTTGLGMIDGENVYRYSVRQGLGDRLTCITIDNENRVWIGSNGYGIYCLDGNQIKHYGGRNIPDVHIKSLKPSPQGGVWAVTAFGGAFKVNNDTITTLQLDLGDSRYPASFAFEDVEGNIWLAAEKKNALLRITENGIDTVFRSSNKKTNKWIGQMKKDGVLWFTSGYNKLYSLNTKTGALDSIQFDCERIKSFDFLNEEIWVDAGYSLIRHKPSSQEEILITHILGTNEQSIRGFFTHNNQLWMCSNNHISFVQDWLIHRPGIKANFSSEGLHQLQDGTLILNYYNDTASHTIYFKDWDYPETVCKDIKLRVIRQAPNGDLWAIRGGKYLGVLDQCELKVEFEKPDSLQAIIGLSFQGDKIWAYTGKHLYLKEGDKPFRFHRTFDKINRVLADRNSDRVYLTSNVNTWMYDNGEWVSIVERFERPAWAPFTAQTKSGEILFATWGDYVYRVNGDSIESMGRNYFTHIARTFTEDEYGNWWLSGQGTGLSVYNGEKFVGLGDLKGQIENDTWGVRNDHLGRFWIASSMGFYRLDPIKKGPIKIDTITDILDNYTIKHFDFRDGVQSNWGEFHYSHNKVYYTDNGDIWLPTRVGNLLFRSKLEGVDNSKPIVFLQWISVNGKTQSQGSNFNENSKFGVAGKFDFPESLTLSHAENNVYFKFGGIDWDDMSQLKYQVYLEGYDQGWREPSANRYVNFENLPSGEYTLRIKAINKVGLESEEIVYTFTIEKAYWETAWFMALMGLLLIIVVYVIIRWRTSALRKRQEKLEQEVDNRTQKIQHQKLEIEIQQKEIVDSIEYAKRIQHAILPSNDKVEKLLGNAFIFYQPKDIVAGDFYWLDKTVDGKTLYAAADCTGHGVPGAMVSVVCNNAINRAVKEFKLSDPGEILDKVREIVINEFDQGSAEVRDGMDIALVKIDGDMISYAGAHNPVWIVRAGEHQFSDENIKVLFENNTSLIEILPDKQPIGVYDNATPFKTHHFNLQEGDMVYTFSDGYADQFGGNSDEALEKYGIKKKGKKLKKSNFKKLLLSISPQAVDQQKDILSTSFIDWRGDLEQLDDVCVIGVRI